MNSTLADLELQRLRYHLGVVTTGGVIEQLSPVGPASVPALNTALPIDLALAVWPFPLEPTPFNFLTSLGYEPVKGFEDEPEQRFFNADKAVRLHVVAAGSDLYTRYVVIRDFLRASAEARERFLKHPENVAAAFLEDAEHWWSSFYGFSPVGAVAKEFGSFTHPWFFSSGWALDLFLGRVTRVHHDVDVIVARTTIQAVRQYLDARGWSLVLPLDGRLEPWPPESPLEPDIQIHAHRDGTVIDLLLTEMDAEIWAYRREPSIICAARQAFLQTKDGLPFLAPELVLLFKSKNTSSDKQKRPQDEKDFGNILPQLTAAQRGWLKGALRQTDSAHPWLASLYSTSNSR